MRTSLRQQTLKTLSIKTSWNKYDKKRHLDGETWAESPVNTHQWL